MNDSKITISSEAAIDLIIRGKELINYHITGELDLHAIEGKIDHELIFKNCTLESLSSGLVKFKHRVRFTGSHLYECFFYSTYFTGGLTIADCTFDTNLTFETGGHNQNDNTFAIINSTFKGFVNFYDCWFQGPVVITNNHFERGTNLLGNKEKPYRVSFDVEPLIVNNIGDTDLDGEGDRIDNTVYLQ